MASPGFSYKPEMGSRESHLAVLQTRIDAGKEALERAEEKPEELKAAAVENAKIEIQAAQKEYDKFLAENPEASMSANS